jgi:lipopolysaccharide export system permease protein
MTIVSRYIAREVVKFMFILTIGLLVIYLAVDFFEKIDDFLENDIPLSKALLYFAYKMPFIGSQMLPLCLLLAVILVFGLMNKYNEILALKSGGVSNYTLFMPILGIGVLTTITLFLISEIVVPITIARANQLWLQEVKKISVASARQQNIWLKEQRRIIHIKFYRPQDATLQGITIYEFDDAFRLVRRVDAQRGVYLEGQWIFHGILAQHRDAESGGFDISFHLRTVEQLELVPEDLKQAVQKAEELGLLQLYELIKKIESEGYDASTYWVDLHAKISFPLVCIIMSFTGTGIAIRKGARDKLAVNVILGIGVAFFYWTLHSVCVSFGYGGMLPPIVAAWVGYLLFFVTGVLFLTYTD